MGENRNRSKMMVNNRSKTSSVCNMVVSNTSILMVRKYSKDQKCYNPGNISGTVLVDTCTHHHTVDRLVCSTFSVKNCLVYNIFLNWYTYGLLMINITPHRLLGFLVKGGMCWEYKVHLLELCQRCIQSYTVWAD